MRHWNRRFDDRGVIRVDGHITYEGLIDLDSIGGEPFQIVQRGFEIPAYRAGVKPLGMAQDEMFDRASKNLPKFRYNTVKGVNVYDLLKYKAVVFTKDSLGSVMERCGVK